MPDTNQMPSVDEVIERNDKQAAQQLQQRYKQAQELIDRQIAQGRQAILNQYEIRRGDMKRKYDAEADPKRKRSIYDQTMSAKSQTMAKIQALKDKHTPAKQELDTQMQAEIQKIQVSTGQRDTRIQYTRQLVAAGFMDATKAKKAEYKLLGIDWEPPVQEQSPKERKAQLITDIKSLDNRLNMFTPVRERGLLKDKGIWWGTTGGDYKDPFTGEERKLNPKKPEDAQIIQDMRNMNIARADMIKELQNIYIMQNPTLRKQIEDTQKYNDAKKIAANGGNLNIEGSINKLLGEQNKGKKSATKYSHLSDAELRAIVGR